MPKKGNSQVICRRIVTSSINELNEEMLKLGEKEYDALSMTGVEDSVCVLMVKRVIK